MDTSITSEVIRTASEYSYLGVLVIGFLGNLFIPVPEEVVLLVLGYAVGTGLFSFLPTVILVIIGAIGSDLLVYKLSERRFRIVELFYEKYFKKILPFNEKFIKKYIGRIVFASRFMVHFRFLGPFLAGKIHYPIKKFIAVEVMALSVYVSLFVWIGMTFQNKIARIASGIGEARNIIGIILVVAIVIFFLYETRVLLLRWLKRVSSHFAG